MQRKKLPQTRQSISRSHRACGFSFTVVVGFYEGTEVGHEGASDPGELFVHLEKTGTEFSGLFDGAVVCASLALQCGVSWDLIREKWAGTRFGRDDEDGLAKSVLDGFVQAVDLCIEERKATIKTQAP